jgi:hypothetical protein
MIRFLKIDSIDSIENQAAARPMCSKPLCFGYKLVVGYQLLVIGL